MKKLKADKDPSIGGITKQVLKQDVPVEWMLGKGKGNRDD